ncbi:hypothetical protein T440DRAFT_135568 [Plenodomus tracheiphilus IPT5]|uniref:Uncharacterized protein n=1 Tax=Plenodomus tracheiphilus IPT5 TaxID=1408161 RepID=A0A6A7B1H7_9PLEO|nr:hypothetical protein T440DRAFT_135568 [Plenodomus tracheiphilus IPT5]
MQAGWTDGFCEYQVRVQRMCVSGDYAHAFIFNMNYTLPTSRTTKTQDMQPTHRQSVLAPYNQTTIQSPLLNSLSPSLHTPQTHTFPISNPTHQNHSSIKQQEKEKEPKSRKKEKDMCNVLLTLYTCTHTSPIHPTSYTRPSPSVDATQADAGSEWPRHEGSSVVLCQDALRRGERCYGLLGGLGRVKYKDSEGVCGGCAKKVVRGEDEGKGEEKGVGH